MLKKIFVIGGLIFAGGVIALAGLIFVLSDASDEYIRPETKAVITEYSRTVKGFIYNEATIHNPAGDMLPDEIDDTIIKEMKKAL